MDSPERERELGGTEQSWCKAVAGGTGIMTIAFSISRKIDHLHLRSVLHNLQSSNQILRAKISPPADPKIFAVSALPYLEIESFSSDETAKLIGDQIGEISPFQRIVEHDLNRNPWILQESSATTTSPLIFAAIYDLPESEKSVVSIRVHSSICDRISSWSILRGVLDQFSEAATDEVTERAIFSSIEEMTGDFGSSKPFWARGINILGYSVSFKRSALLPFQDTINPRSSQILRTKFTPEETSSLLSICTSRGIKLSGALTAAMLVASVSSKQLPAGRSESYTVLTIIDSRKFLDPNLEAHDLGFYNSAIQTLQSVSEDDDLFNLAEQYQNSISNAINEKKHILDMGDLNLLMCKAIENPFLTPYSSMRTSLISVFEETVIHDRSQIYKNAGIEDFFACSSVHGVGPSIAIFDSIQEEQLHLDFVFPSPLHSRDQIQALADHARNLLVMPEKRFRGRRPPTPLWRKNVHNIVGDPVDIDLPLLRQKARATSRELTFRPVGWPRSQPHDLDEAVQRWLYIHISDRIRTALETLRSTLKI